MHFLQLLVYQIKLKSPASTTISSSSLGNISSGAQGVREASSHTEPLLTPPSSVMIRVAPQPSSSADQEDVLGQPGGPRCGPRLPKAILGRECRCCWTLPRHSSWHHRRSQKDPALPAWARGPWELGQNCSLVAETLYFLNTSPLLLSGMH